ncbi:MAG TPA: hypothetical protein VHQ47_09670 [Phycisphaerae bacterium]|jgi:hypothetical protein|nr:hypothetical protein [Phycisphaerae bacterium]
MKHLKFQELVEEKKVITVTPKYPPYDTCMGFALGASEEMVLLHEIVEFHLAGYSVMPLYEIRSVRSKKAERMVERIFEGEGLMKKVGLEEMPPLSDWPDLFQWFRRAGRLVQVEFFETPEPGFSDEAFAVGKITGLSSRSVAVLNFDPSGNWDSEATVISYDNIKRVRFETEYINVFAKYLGK